MENAVRNIWRGAVFAIRMYQYSQKANAGDPIAFNEISPKNCSVNWRFTEIKHRIAVSHTNSFYMGKCSCIITIIIYTYSSLLNFAITTTAVVSLPSRRFFFWDGTLLQLIGFSLNFFVWHQSI